MAIQALFQIRVIHTKFKLLEIRKFVFLTQNSKIYNAKEQLKLVQDVKIKLITPMVYVGDIKNKEKMKNTIDLIQIAQNGANLIIDCKSKSIIDLIRILTIVGINDAHITIKNAQTLTTLGIIQIAKNLS